MIYHDTDERNVGSLGGNADLSWSTAMTRLTSQFFFAEFLSNTFDVFAKRSQKYKTLPAMARLCLSSGRRLLIIR